ncbi:transposon Tf2-9 polyprotein [Nephila pilipes]|uniref:Transposon Tf2-9 polyprotein n=1 Tax=Nephila pilipes TaxID=299642 RepID=A0A8X6U6C8_NEPPI|nr:transposon Tf2-9 polyprotein [Nephila pilipes]
MSGKNRSIDEMGYPRLFGLASTLIAICASVSSPAIVTFEFLLFLPFSHSPRKRKCLLLESRYQIFEIKVESKYIVSYFNLTTSYNGDPGERTKTCSFLCYYYLILTKKIAEIAAVKIPPYNFSDSQLWFAIWKRNFSLGVPKPITDTCTKFNYIVSHLPPKAAAIIRDIIINPDETAPYSAIKMQLIQRTGESS